MSGIGQTMTIVLSADQVAKLDAWTKPMVTAHVDAGVLVPGFEIVLTLAGPFGQSAMAQWGREKLDLGDIEVTREGASFSGAPIDA